MTDERLTAEERCIVEIIHYIEHEEMGCRITDEGTIRVRDLIRTYAAEARKAASIDSDMPQRRIVATIKIGADDAEELIIALQDITTEIAMKIDRTGSPCRDSVSGSPSSGSIVTIVENEGVTHDSYFEEIKRWEKARESARMEAKG